MMVLNRNLPFSSSSSFFGFGFAKIDIFILSGQSTYSAGFLSW
jgi:hypothetical protein